MGSSEGADIVPGEYFSGNNWSSLGPLLGPLGETPLFNAINFNWGVCNCARRSYYFNATVIEARIKTFLCPSDPNSAAPVTLTLPFITACTNYAACQGTTTLQAPATPGQPSDGLFTYQNSYSIAACLDGTSNTVAFSEARVGPPTVSYVPTISIDFVTTIPAAAQQVSIYNDVTDVLAGLAACDNAYLSQTATLSNQRGGFWAKGVTAMTMFNTIVPPNSPQHPWSSCSPLTAIGYAIFANATSYHPAGVNTLFADGSVKCIKSTISPNVWWALGTRASGEVVSADQY
jgi:prepilin-type processing-associated H-X9-DG protein